MSRRPGRVPDHLDAWAAYFSPRRPLIQWVCGLSDREAQQALRALGLPTEPEPAPPREGPTLWDGNPSPEKPPAAGPGVGGSEAR